MRLLTALLFFALCATAQAEDFSVKTTSANGFTPQELTVKPGDSVTFSNAGGFHNVVWVEGTFDDGSQASPPDPAFVWPTDPVRTFNAEGTFHYYCEQHGTAEGAGMAGKVTVSSTAPPPDTVAPALTKVRAGVHKRRPFVAFNVSEAARIVGGLVRRKAGPDKHLAELDRNVEAGDRRLSFAKRKLKRGRYYVMVSAIDAAGNQSPVTKAPFKVA